MKSLAFLCKHHFMTGVLIVLIALGILLLALEYRDSKVIGPNQSQKTTNKPSPSEWVSTIQPLEERIYGKVLL